MSASRAPRRLADVSKALQPLRLRVQAVQEGHSSWKNTCALQFLKTSRSVLDSLNLSIRRMSGLTHPRKRTTSQVNWSAAALHSWVGRLSPTLLSFHRPLSAQPNTVWFIRAFLYEPPHQSFHMVYFKPPEQSFRKFFARRPLFVSKINYGSSCPCSHKYRVPWWQVAKIICLYQTATNTYRQKRSKCVYCN